MSNLFLNIPVPAANGVGAAVDVSAMGKTKSLVIGGGFDATVNVEFSTDLVGLVWAPLATFHQSGNVTIDVAARWLRAVTSHYKSGAPNLDVGSDDAGTFFVLMPAAGTAVDISLLPLFKTVVSPVKAIVEVSEDGITWAQIFSLPNGGDESRRFVGKFARVVGGVDVTMAGANDCGCVGPIDLNWELWAMDQSNTFADPPGPLNCGGTLYIYQAAELLGLPANANPTKIDLGGAFTATVKAATGTVPVRPHFVAFNATFTHAILSFVASGHVVIMDAATRTIVFSVDVGTQAHTAIPSPDDTYIIVTNQNGKLLQRINTNYVTNTFALDGAATLDLAAGVTPSGALKQAPGIRPDTAPIVAAPSSDGNLAFITLRGGGFFVVNPRTNPISIVGEYTIATVVEAGLYAAQIGNTIFFNSGVNSAIDNYIGICYKLPVVAFNPFVPNLVPDVPAPIVVFNNNPAAIPGPGGPKTDGHAIGSTADDRQVWVIDRAGQFVTVVDAAAGVALGSFPLLDPDAPGTDLAPDIIGYGHTPVPDFVFFTMQGPLPLTGNNPVLNNAKGDKPGVGRILVIQNGLSGILNGIFEFTNIVSGVETADGHGIAYRRL